MAMGAQRVGGQIARNVTHFQREEEPIDLLRSLSREIPIRARARVR